MLRQKVNVTMSQHARDRLTERFSCRPEKALKIVKKAWKSEEVTPRLVAKATRENQRPQDTWRSFLGCLFIFDTRYNNSAHCVTVINPRIKEFQT